MVWISILSLMSIAATVAQQGQATNVNILTFCQVPFARRSLLRSFQVDGRTHSGVNPSFTYLMFYTPESRGSWAKFWLSQTCYRFLSKSFNGSCTGNGIISGKPWATYEKFCDRINLHTKLYISPFYKKIVSCRICLKIHSATFICENSLQNSTLVQFIFSSLT